MDILPDSLATTAYGRLKNDIVSGFWPPGTKLGIAALRKHYDCGATPLREALNRLAAEGWVDHLEQRGFAVTEVSDDALRELIDTRMSVEALALNKAIQIKTPEWEEKVVIALHRLSKTPRSLSAEHYKENPEWEKLHRAFHMALIENCGSRWLIAFCAQLYDQAYRYRRLAKTPYKPRNVMDEHQTIVDAMVKADNGDACNALHVHYKKTASILLSTKTDAAEQSKG